MLQGLRGSTYGWVDLRVAVEAETGRDMGEFFRRWLNEPGIPENFRKRYEVKKD
jgi:aminopeptidase N